VGEQIELENKKKTLNFEQEKPRDLTGKKNEAVKRILARKNLLIWSRGRGGNSR
jgi:hypothetical protein